MEFAPQPQLLLTPFDGSICPPQSGMRDITGYFDQRFHGLDPSTQTGRGYSYQGLFIGDTTIVTLGVVWV
jgi:hypothetical protein